MLATAIELEASEWVEARSTLRDEDGHHVVVRNGYQPTRKIQTDVGDVEVRKPRVRDRRAGVEREAFTSKILPPYLRRTKAIEELIPWLYLKGISSGGFSEALQSLLGPDGAGLSATTVTVWRTAPRSPRAGECPSPHRDWWGSGAGRLGAAGCRPIARVRASNWARSGRSFLDY